MDCNKFSALPVVNCATDFSTLGVQNGAYVQIPKSCLSSLSGSVTVCDPLLIPANIKAGITITCGTQNIVGTYNGGTCTLGGVTASQILSGVTATCGSNTIVGTYIPGTCALGGDATAADILNGKTVTCGATTVTGTYSCPATVVVPRYYSQNTAPTAGVVDGDYWNDTTTNDPVRSYIRTGGSWVFTGFGNVDPDLTAATVRELTNIYGVVGTHQTTVSNILLDAGTPDSQVFGIGPSFIMSRDTNNGGGSMVAHTASAGSIQRVAFIGMMKYANQRVILIKAYDYITGTFLPARTLGASILESNSNGGGYEIRQNGDLLHFCFYNYDGNFPPNQSYSYITYDISTNTLDAITPTSYTMGAGDLIQSINASFAGGTYNLNFGPGNGLNPTVNTNTYGGFPLIGADDAGFGLRGNTIVGTNGVTYFAKVSCFTTLAGANPLAAVGSLFCATTP